MHSHTPRQVVKGDENELRHICDVLDTQSSQDPGAGNRRTSRLAYRAGIVIVRLRVPGCNLEPPFVAPTRNISSGGLAFFHARLVHARSRCTVRIQTRSGAWHDIDGAIVHCRKISDSLYELGVRFDHKLNTSQYVAIKERDTECPAEPSAE